MANHYNDVKRDKYHAYLRKKTILRKNGPPTMSSLNIVPTVYSVVDRRIVLAAIFASARVYS